MLRLPGETINMCYRGDSMSSATTLQSPCLWKSFSKGVEPTPGFGGSHIACEKTTPVRNKYETNAMSSSLQVLVVPPTKGFDVYQQCVTFGYIGPPANYPTNHLPTQNLPTSVLMRHNILLKLAHPDRFLRPQ